MFANIVKAVASVAIGVLAAKGAQRVVEKNFASEIEQLKMKKRHVDANAFYVRTFNMLEGFEQTVVGRAFEQARAENRIGLKNHNHGDDVVFTTFYEGVYLTQNENPTPIFVIARKCDITDTTVIEIDGNTLFDGKLSVIKLSDFIAQLMIGKATHLRGYCQE